MLVDALMIVAGIVILFFGGEWLVRGSSLLAMRMGIPPIIVGVTIVAIGTSTPELMVSIKAALDGANDIALGNVVGSNIANVLLILGVSAAIRVVTSVPSVTRVHMPFMVVLTVGVLLMMHDGILSRLDGLLLVAAMAGYLAYAVHEARRDGSGPGDDCGYTMPAGRGTGYLLLLIIAGLGLLMFGARLLVSGAVSLARDAGITEAFIGLTIVAIGTSLPELTTSVIAAVRKAGDIAIGNVVGSNIFNIVFILGTTGSLNQLAQGGVTWVDMGVMLASSTLLLVLLFTRRQVGRASGIAMVAGYVGYTAWLASNI